MIIEILKMCVFIIIPSHAYDHHHKTHIRQHWSGGIFRLWQKVFFQPVIQSAIKKKIVFLSCEQIGEYF